MTLSTIKDRSSVSQRWVEKTRYSLNEEKEARHGLTTFQKLISTGTLQVIGYGDETYNCISVFWRKHRRASRGHKPDPLEPLLGPAELAACTTTNVLTNKTPLLPDHQAR